MNIIHDTMAHRFQVEVDGFIGHVDYQLVEGDLDVRHTIVPKEIGGRGIAGALVKAAYDYALQEHLRCVATCSYAVKWLEKHPEYNGEKGCDFAGEGSCAL